MSGIPELIVLPADQQPPVIEVTCRDNIFIKAIMLPKQGMAVPQHAHKYGHTSYLARGSIDAWADNDSLGHFVAPRAIWIEAGKKHTFITLEDNTLILCIHNVLLTGEVEIDEMHEFGGTR